MDGFAIYGLTEYWRASGDPGALELARTTFEAAGPLVRRFPRHFELGWNLIRGGLFLAVDADGREEVAWSLHDSKLWWPHTEALYATLLAWEHSREAWCLDWRHRIREYAYAHYPVPGHGEWTQKLDRRGRPFADVVALPVKDPFHLPRALIYCLALLDGLD